MKVQVLDASQLLLPHVQVESSGGCCRLARPGCLIWSSIFGVPLLVVSALQVLLLSILGAELVLVAPAVLLGLCSCGHQWIHTRNLLRERIRCYQQRFDKPLACDAGPLRAVHFQQLTDFQRTFDMFILQRNMHYVVHNIMRPFTKPWKLSFAEITGAPCSLDTPGYFYVSHVWKAKFRDFLVCLEAHADGRSTDYWIDAFSANQWDLPSEMAGNVGQSSFSNALRSSYSIGLVVAFSDASGLVDWMSRTWCLFEMYEGYRIQRSGYAGVLLCAPSGVLNYGRCSPEFCMQCIEKINCTDLRSAWCLEPEDREQIEAHLCETGGWEEMEGSLSSNGIHFAIPKSTLLRVFCFLSPIFPFSVH